MDFSGLSREELIERLEALEPLRSALAARQAEAAEHQRVLYDLGVHQVELEAQNQALRESQHLEEAVNRYADLFDFAPLPYCALDRNGVVREINLTGAEFLGLRRGNIVGKPFVTLVRFDDLEPFVRHLQRCLESVVSVSAELSFSTAIGHADVQAVSRRVHGVRGEVVGCRTVFVDVSERKLAERRADRARTGEAILRERLQHIDRAARAMSTALARLSGDHGSDFFQVIVDEARAVAGADYAALGIGGELGRVFDTWVTSGLNAEEAAAVGAAPRGVGVLGAVVRSERTIRSTDLRSHTAFSGLPPHHPPMASFLGVPVNYQGQPRGNLFVAKRDGAREFSEQDQIAVEELADRVGVALEIARLRQVEAREHARLEFLAQAGPALATSIDLAPTLEAIGALIVPATADMCAVNLFDDDGRCRKRMVRHADVGKQALLEQLVGHELVCTHSLQLVPEVTEAYLARAIPDAAARDVFRQSGARSSIAVPLVVRGEPIGLLHVTRGEGRPRFTQDDVPLLSQLAQLASLAIENARLHEATTHSARHHRFVAEVGAALADSIDYWDTFATIARVVLRELADWCVLDVDGEESRRLKVVHADPAKNDACEALERIPIAADQPSLCHTAMHTRKPAIVADVDDAFLRSVAQSDEHLSALRALEPRSIMSLPLVAHGRVLGCLALVSSRPERRYGAAELALARELADRAALALNSARLYEAARHAIATRDDVMAIVSHDLRNALAPIKMSLSFLGHPPPTGERRNRKHVQAIDRAANHMARIIDDLRDVVMIESGQFTLDPRPEPLAPLLSDALDLFAPQAEARALRLSLDVDEDVSAQCDAKRIQQVIANLTGNALKFTESGGEVRISARRVGSQVEVAVADSGCGISAEELPHVFERFWKGRGTGAHGTGLGLYIARAIVEAHGGSIRVESEPGRGTTFRFTIPTAAAALDHPSATAPM